MDPVEARETQSSYVIVLSIAICFLLGGVVGYRLRGAVDRSKEPKNIQVEVISSGCVGSQLCDTTVENSENVRCVIEGMLGYKRETILIRNKTWRRFCE